MNEQQSPEVLFDKVTQFVNESHALLAAGAFIELAGLDDHVRTLCEALIQLSQAERIQHAQRIQQLLLSISELEKSMMQCRDKMAVEMRGLSTHQKANVAYRTVESIDAYKRDDEE